MRLQTLCLFTLLFTRLLGATESDITLSGTPDRLEYFVGEEVRATLKISVGEGDGIKLIKPECLLKRDVLSVRMCTLKGEQVEAEGIFCNGKIESDDDFKLLKAGDVCEWNCKAESSPQKADNYFLTVEVRPTADRKRKLTKQMVVGVIDVPEQDTLKAWKTRIPSGIPYSMELLVIKLKYSTTLAVRLKYGKNVQTLTRLVSVDEDTDLVVETIKGGNKESPTFCCRVKQDGKPVTYTIDSSGRIVAPKDPKDAKQIEQAEAEKKSEPKTK